MCKSQGVQVGTPVAGADCTTHGANICLACDDEFYLEAGQCKSYAGCGEPEIVLFMPSSSSSSAESSTALSTFTARFVRFSLDATAADSYPGGLVGFHASLLQLGGIFPTAGSLEGVQFQDKLLSLGLDGATAFDAGCECCGAVISMRESWTLKGNEKNA